MFHGKMDSPPMPFSIARSAIFRHGRVTCMYYSEMEDDNFCSIRKIEDANMKISRVADFLFEENDQREKHDVCRCISTSMSTKDELTTSNDDPKASSMAARSQEASIAYFTNSNDLCQYIKSSVFSGVVQHVSADCGPELCETRYRMLKTSWYRQTISTEMKINTHRASSSEYPVHERFCTFDGPMHLVDTYPTCSKKLNAKIVTFIKTIKNVVNAYIPLSYEIWNGEFYLNHSRTGVLRFEFASFIQIVSKQHFSSLETVDQLIPKPCELKSGSSEESSFKIAQNSTALSSSKLQATRPHSACSTITLSHNALNDSSQIETLAPKSPQLSISNLHMQLSKLKNTSRSPEVMLDATLEEDCQPSPKLVPPAQAYLKLKEGKPCCVLYECACRDFFN